MDKVKNIFYALIFWRTQIGEILNKIYDLKLHFKYSFKLSGNIKKEQLASYIQKNFHVIEKGLGLPEPRPGFGKTKILDILKNARYYAETYGHDTLITSTVATLNDYLQFNKEKNEDLTSDYYVEIKNFIKKYPPVNQQLGGIKRVSKKDILDSIDINFEKFVKSRNSVRDFSKEEVPVELVKQALGIAKYAPSVCNRQGWKMHLYTKPEKIEELLALQNGNRGFSNSINKLIIITGDITSFTKYESNQLFVDGGLFAMNLILSLHSKGIGSIALNTDIPYVIEKKMRQIGNIPDNERLIMYLGIGMLKDTYSVAISHRKDNEKILKVHE